jgi:uncharacterized protein
MTQNKAYTPGTFCWIDLMTKDANKARSFYGEILGWKFEDRPAGEGTYTMVMNKNDVVAGLFEDPEELEKNEIPPHWNTYIAVENADQTTTKAKSLGATIIADAFDVMDVGRMAVIQDPTGAIFSVWQTKKHAGAGGDHFAPGNWCWNETGTRDLAKSKKFYSELFGWTITDSNSNKMAYSEITHGGRTIGGIWQIPETQEMKDVPPHWMVYFTVDDIKKRTEQAKKLGGTAYMENGEGDSGILSIIEDPQGAAFGLMQVTKRW